MTLPVARIGDTFNDTDIIATGSGDVFINNIPAARLGDMTTGHPGPPLFPGHGFYLPAPIDSGSGSVFVNNLPLARMADTHAPHLDPPHTDKHPGTIITASGDVFAG